MYDAQAASSAPSPSIRAVTWLGNQALNLGASHARVTGILLDGELDRVAVDPVVSVLPIDPRSQRVHRQVRRCLQQTRLVDVAQLERRTARLLRGLVVPGARRTVASAARGGATAAARSGANTRGVAAGTRGAGGRCPARARRAGRRLGRATGRCDQCHGTHGAGQQHHRPSPFLFDHQCSFLPRESMWSRQDAISGRADGGRGPIHPEALKGSRNSCHSRSGRHRPGHHRRRHHDPGLRGVRPGR